MNNEMYFNLIKGNYESLNSFYMRDNTLFYQDTSTYMLTLEHITLANINTNLFLLSPRDIYRVLYLLELLPKRVITENDKLFINEYVIKYLDLEDKKLSNEEIEEHKVDCLGMPIYFSDDPSLENTPASIEIHKVLNEHTENVKAGKSNGPRLVLTNPNFIIEEEQNDLIEVGKAGFTTLLIIAGTVIATCIYIALFIAK